MNNGFFFPTLSGLWDIGSLTRDLIWAFVSESAKPSPPDCQGIPDTVMEFFNGLYFAGQFEKTILLH